MTRSFHFFAGPMICLLLVTVAARPAAAQPSPRDAARFFRLVGEIPVTTLAQLDVVSKALQLDEEQKRNLTSLNNALNDARRQIWQDAAGDFDAMRQDTIKLLTEYEAKVKEVLKDDQQKRAEEIFVQVNGPSALTSHQIAEQLKLNEEQRKKLTEATMDHFFDMFDFFQDSQDMTDEERSKAVDKLVETRDKNLLAVLTEEQSQQFEDMKGEAIEVDLSKLPFPGRG